MSNSVREDALHRLVKLGDMMGDGLHYEPGGGWITKEYRKALTDIGILPKKKKPKDTTQIDKFMSARTHIEHCDCGGGLKQTRKGSLRAKCLLCGKVFQLGRKQK